MPLQHSWNLFAITIHQLLLYSSAIKQCKYLVLQIVLIIAVGEHLCILSLSSAEDVSLLSLHSLSIVLR